jgi:hypothetical protein
VAGIRMHLPVRSGFIETVVRHGGTATAATRPRRASPTIQSNHRVFRAGVIDVTAFLREPVKVVLADDVAQAATRQLVVGGRSLRERKDRLRDVPDAIQKTALTLIVPLSHVIAICLSGRLSACEGRLEPRVRPRTE